MKISFICSEYPPGPHGGIGTLTQIIARALQTRGHEVRIVGTYPADYPAPDRQNDEGVDVWRYREPRLRKIGWILARLRLIAVVRGLAQRNEVDLVEVPDYQGWAAGLPALPVPIVVRAHGSAAYFAAELRRPLSRLTYVLERSSIRRADFWISVSEYLSGKTQLALNFDREPNAILYNPVEVPAPQSNPERTRNRVVFSGTLNHKKGIIPLLLSWPQVKVAFPDAILDVYGKDGRTVIGESTRAFISTQLSNNCLDGVRLHGVVARSQLLTALRTARVAVFPSLAEAFALAPLEAMACGCPTVFSDRTSGPELIENGVDGLLVDPESPAAIAEAIIRVLGNNALASQLGDAGRSKVRARFSNEILIPQNEAFYAKCIDIFYEHTAGQRKHKPT